MNPKKPERQVRELLERYIKGECTGQEIALLEKWYERVVRDREVVQLLSVEEEERLVLELWKAVAAREGEESGEEEEPEVGVRTNTRRIFRYAAIWAGLIMVTGWGWVQYNKRYLRSALQKTVVFTEISTGYQQVRKVLLPDSTIVWLNSATHLAYHPDFMAHREVRLSGEAFFQVARDMEHPFVVKAGNAATHVIGTAFNVSAYPEAGQLRISLQSGKVDVEYHSKGGKKVEELKPGELLIFDKESGAGQVVQQAPGEMDVWTGGRLLFYKTPLKEALAQIEARYGVHIVYDHPLKNQTVTARFDNTALEQVLSVLSFGWELRFTRIGDTLHVR